MIKSIPAFYPAGQLRCSNLLLQIGPTVFDRVIQQAIVQVLSPIVDPTFSDHSYGFRPKRSPHQAVKQVQEYVKQGRIIAVDVDLSKFFDLYLLLQ